MAVHFGMTTLVLGQTALTPLPVLPKVKRGRAKARIKVSIGIGRSGDGGDFSVWSSDGLVTDQASCTVPAGICRSTSHTCPSLCQTSLMPFSV